MGKTTENLVGKRFGNLVVLGPAEPYYYGDHGQCHRRWNCLCDCGREFVAFGYRLRDGVTTACEQCSRHRYHPNTNMLGKRFGMLTVLERELDESKRPDATKCPFYKCKCDCGNLTYASYSQLTRGKTNCGCRRGRYIVPKCGDRFGHLTVLCNGEDYVSPKGKHIKTFHCLCDCGNTRDLKIELLVGGKVTACGGTRHKELSPLQKLCANDVHYELVGQKIGSLTIERLAERRFENSSYKFYYLCTCDCGETVFAEESDIINKKIHSDHCITKYVGGLVGQRFGKLLVTEYIGKEKSPSGVTTYYKYKCHCDCGNDVEVNAVNLIQGNTRSCGCGRKNVPRPNARVNLAGQRFGHLTVLSRADEYRYGNNGKFHHMWNCLCDCGNEYLTYGHRLLTGEVTACETCSRSKPRELALDLTGKRFGALTVIERVFDESLRPVKKNDPMWRCRCDCGNEVIRVTHQLVEGSKLSCGCLSDISKNFPFGTKFGNLTVTGRGEDYFTPKGKRVKTYHCLCDCGETRDVRSGDLTRGVITACGGHKHRKTKEE